jgi:2-polyprenyl-3-methyl-5-hydroxy-6-metoxy-1,4-benzoquinol methylase
MSTETYIGTELEVFAHALNWKEYVRHKIDPYLKGDVLEVGAGIGTNTPIYTESAQYSTWTCLEPDAALAAQIPIVPRSERIVGTLRTLANRQFEALIYLDVVEHIEDDATELLLASKVLKPGGHLIILVPAHQWLYTPFDKAIGHFRRYSRSTLLAAAPSSLQLVLIQYLDSVGMLASMANKLLLNSAHPTVAQIKMWDQILVPPSKILDVLTAHRVGKSLLAIWRRP